MWRKWRKQRDLGCRGWVLGADGCPVPPPGALLSLGIVPQVLLPLHTAVRLGQQRQAMRSQMHLPCRLLATLGLCHLCPISSVSFTTQDLFTGIDMKVANVLELPWRAAGTERLCHQR